MSSTNPADGTGDLVFGSAEEESDYLVRELSARTVLLHEAVAARVGLSATEHKCLDLLVRAGRPLTAGELAELSGLTTGAITGIVDRLERAGFAARERSSEDRRKVLVRPLPYLYEKYGATMAGIQRANAEINALYTEQEQALIRSIVWRWIEALKTETARLRTEVQADLE